MAVQPPFEIDIAEFRNRRELKITITWHLGYKPEELIPVCVPALLVRICTAVADHMRNGPQMPTPSKGGVA